MVEVKTYHDTGKMRIEHAAILVILAMNLQEVSPEVLNDRFIVV
jgi:molybdopterin synthase catalytic subunit